MAKISAFDQYKDAKVRRQQVVYLHANGFTNDQIAKIAGYAKSTVAIGLWYNEFIQEEGTIMEVAIHVTYFVNLDDEDVEKIEAGEMSADDIDWNYYLGEASEIDLECVDIL